MSKGLKLERSFALWKEALSLIPNGTQTLSKGPTQFSFGVSPIYAASGKGAEIFDVDGNRYIDSGMGLHAVILGYSEPHVTEAICKSVRNGIQLTLMHPLEVEVAALFSKRIPCAEQVRFTKTGSEATSAAVKIARAVTGRGHIATCGYHGWHDWFLGVSEKTLGIASGIERLVHKFHYNDSQSLERIFNDYPDQIAAVIMEPCLVDSPRDDFLSKCREIAKSHESLFIFDETITGVRWHAAGAQSLFNVIPDLAVFGKSIANGMPLAAIVGKKQYMEILNDSRFFFSSTFAGEFASLAACKATYEVIDRFGVIGKIWERGEMFINRFNDLIHRHELSDFLEIKGFPCRPTILFKKREGSSSQEAPLAIKSYMQQESAERGLLFTGYFALSFSHDEEIIDRILTIVDSVLKKLKTVLTKGTLMTSLRGEIVSPVFRSL